MVQRFIFIFVFCALSFQFELYSTTVQPRSKDEKIRSSTYVCALEIVDAKAKDNGKGFIRTLANARIIECLKGDLSGFVNLELPGGSIEKKHDHGGTEKITSLVVGAPRFSIGESVVLHLNDAENIDGLVFYSLADWEVERLEKIEHQDGVNYVLQSGSKEDLKSYRETVNKALE